MAVEDEQQNCTACPIGDAIERRDFLRDMTMRALAAMGALAVAPAVGGALPYTLVTGHGSRTAKLYPIPAADGVAIDKDESVIVARFNDCAYAFSLACPHQNTALRWEERNRRFQCPKHKSRYQPDGVFIEGRATRGMDRFAVSRDAAMSQLVVDLDVLYRQDKHPREWEAAFVNLAPRP